MSADFKNHSTHTNGDIITWMISRAEATRDAGATLPEWMVGVFEEAKKRETETEGASAAVKDPSESKECELDDIFQFRLVYFKVENTIFTVIKDWLMVDGSPFQDMFSLPHGESTLAAIEGTEVTTPIVLAHTNSTSFKAFLSLLYGSRGKPLQSCDEWTGALDLAMRWNFDQVRKQATAGLDSCLSSSKPAARILLGRRFSVRSWLRMGLIELVQEVTEERLTRDNLMDGKEFSLDMTTIANVFYACFKAKISDQELEASIKSDRNICVHRSAFGGPSTFASSGASVFGGSYPSNCLECERSRQIHKQNMRLLRYGSIVDDIFGTEIRGCTYHEL